MTTGDQGLNISTEAQQWINKQGFYDYEGMTFFSNVTTDVVHRVLAFDFADNDVLISTYPRSGTTWTQEMAWLICNNADTETARKTKLDFRVPFLELTGLHTKEAGVDVARTMVPPRLVKSHLYPQLFKQRGNSKLIFMLRNYKDVLVSCFHFAKDLFGFKGSWNDFFEMAKKDQVFYGSWLRHCLKCWELRHDPKVLILKYEEAKKDHVGTLRTLAQFLEKSPSEEEIHAIAEYTRVGNMQKVYDEYDGKHPDEYTNFIRKGIVGEWRDWFTDDQLDYVNVILKEAEEKGLLFSDKID